MSNVITEEPFDIFRSLRVGTQDAHRQIEQRVPVFSPDFDLPKYVKLLEGFYGFWAPLEAKLSLIEPLHHPDLEIDTRLKSHLLEDDLRFLGSNPSTVLQCTKLPTVETFPSALGCLYVMEGSTLGGRLISARIEDRLNVRHGTGASFFNAYGDKVGERWSAFKSFVRPRTTATGEHEIVTAACRTFELFDDWLGKGT